MFLSSITLRDFRVGPSSVGCELRELPLQNLFPFKSFFGVRGRACISSGTSDEREFTHTVVVLNLEADEQTKSKYLV